jgi:hypothetical protein
MKQSLCLSVSNLLLQIEQAVQCYFISEQAQSVLLDIRRLPVKRHKFGYLGDSAFLQQILIALLRLRPRGQWDRQSEGPFKDTLS